MLIDSHHHLWRYSADDYPWINDQMDVLRRDYWTAELERIAGDHAVDRFVTVQARQSLAETETLLQLADANPLIGGVVGWVDFRSSAVGEQIERFAGHPKLKGFRHVVQDEPDDRFILAADFNRGIGELCSRNLVYDVLIFARQLEPAIEFVASHPDIPMVLDHIAKPVIAGDGMDASWRRGVERLAEMPNVSCKFSGLATEVVSGDWDIETLRPYWDVVLEAFTPDRLMFGSDWPVCLLRTGYGRWLETVRRLAEPLSPGEQQQLFCSTAKRVYDLE